MTKSEAIAKITAQLESLDDERVLAVAGIVNEIAAPGGLPRPLTAAELAAINRSKDDFQDGRTLSAIEARERTETFLIRRRAQRAKA